MNTRQHWVETNIPCPCGGSTDAFSVDSKGDGFCFSGFCKKPNWNNYKKKEVNEITEEPSNTTSTYANKGSVKFMSHRGVSEKTCRLYDIQTKIVDGEPVEVAFKFPHKTMIRNLDTGVRRMIGETKTPGCFGIDKFEPGSKEAIIITTGDWDAPSAYEATRGRYAAVSAGGDQQARKNILHDRDKINSFKKIILLFDGDESGQNAAKQVSNLFDFNKLYQVRLTKHKDANEYFKHNDVDTLEKAIQAAKRYSPDNIISTFFEIEHALEESKEDLLGTYPYETLQRMTYGLHKGEVVVFKGLEKIGKTEIFRAMVHHLLKTTSLKLGLMFFEEDNGTTIKGIAQYELQMPAMLPDSGLSKEDIFKAYKTAVGNEDDRLFLYQSFETEDEEIFLDNVRFLAAGAGCQILFLDHISWLATGKDDSDNRKKLDRLTQKLKLLAKELGICICMISHVNDNGLTRDSRNITKVANTILHMERDKTAMDDHIRRTTYLTLEGVRLGGQTGPAGELYLDPMTSTLKEKSFAEKYPVEERIKVN